MDKEEQVRRQRRGYWLKRAREHAGLKLAAAASLAGLAPGSGSTVSHWEAGNRQPRIDQLERLADAYGVPLDLFTHPPMTDDERIEAVSRAASDRERYDWEAAQAPAGAGAPGDAHRTRLA